MRQRVATFEQCNACHMLRATATQWSPSVMHVSSSTSVSTDQFV
jgi:hypothetical protein